LLIIGSGTVMPGGPCGHGSADAISGSATSVARTKSRLTVRGGRELPGAGESDAASQKRWKRRTS
jgi:hypothetical protein